MQTAVKVGFQLATEGIQSESYVFANQDKTSLISELVLNLALISFGGCLAQ